MKRVWVFYFVSTYLSYFSPLESHSLVTHEQAPLQTISQAQLTSRLGRSSRTTAFDLFGIQVNKPIQCFAKTVSRELEEEKDNIVVYWKVTENGYSRCHINCLLEQIAVDGGRHRVTDQPLDNILSALTSSQLETNVRVRLNSTLWVSSKRDGSIILDRKLKPDDAYLGLSCDPYINETEFDFLETVANRAQVQSMPEPNLLVTSFSNIDSNLDSLYKRLLNIFSNSTPNAYIYNLNANFYRVIGNARQAIECFRKALHIEPSSRNVLLNLAHFLIKLEAYDDAIQVYQKLVMLADAPKDAFLLNEMLGEIFQLLGMYQDALQLFKQAQDIYPNSPALNSQILEVEQIIDQLGPNYIQSAKYTELRDKYVTGKCLNNGNKNTWFFHTFSDLHVRNVWLHVFVIVLIILASNFFKILNIVLSGETMKKPSCIRRSSGKRVSFDDKPTKHELKRFYSIKRKL